MTEQTPPRRTWLLVLEAIACGNEDFVSIASYVDTHGGPPPTTVRCAIHRLNKSGLIAPLLRDRSDDDCWTLTSAGHRWVSRIPPTAGLNCDENATRNEGESVTDHQPTTGEAAPGSPSSRVTSQSVKTSPETATEQLARAAAISPAEASATLESAERAFRNVKAGTSSPRFREARPAELDDTAPTCGPAPGRLRLTVLRVAASIQTSIDRRHRWCGRTVAEFLDLPSAAQHQLIHYGPPRGRGAFKAAVRRESRRRFLAAISTKPVGRATEILEDEHGLTIEWTPIVDQLANLDPWQREEVLKVVSRSGTGDEPAVPPEHVDWTAIGPDGAGLKSGVWDPATNEEMVRDLCDRIDRGEKIVITMGRTHGRRALSDAVAAELNRRRERRGEVADVFGVPEGDPLRAGFGVRAPLHAHRGSDDDGHWPYHTQEAFESAFKVAALAATAGDAARAGVPSLGMKRVAAVMRAGKEEHGDRWKTRDAAHHLRAAERHIKRHKIGEPHDHDLHAQGKGKHSHLACAGARILMALHLVDDPEDGR